jgi:FAD/FMN-containing dehydrogenase
MTSDLLAAELSGALGSSHVLADPELRAPYEVDWTRRWQGTARLVARPGSTGQVSTVLRAARRAGVPVLPQGGNTGLVGGSVPRGGEVVISLARMADVEPVDSDAAQVTVGAGASLARVQSAAAASGFDVPVDLASRSQATIGGMAATNAGGVHVVRRGSMRRNVAGLEVVLPDGSVLRRLSGLAKDNTGYDLVGLVVGSEGTLAIITRVVLDLVPTPAHRVTALLGLTARGGRAGAARAAVEVFRRLRLLPSLEAFELVYPDGVSLVVEHAGLGAPGRGQEDAFLVVECAANRDPVGELADALEDCPAVTSSAVASDTRAREALWAYRERHTEAIAACGVAHKADVDLPLSRLADFAGAVGPAVQSAHAGARTFLFGHVGDGNLHVNVVGPAPDDMTVDHAVMQLALEHGGSISAEHGIGVAKVGWLARARSPEEIATMRKVKDAIDPDGILNPGVLLPLGDRRGLRGQDEGSSSYATEAPSASSASRSVPWDPS